MYFTWRTTSKTQSKGGEGHWGGNQGPVLEDFVSHFMEFKFNPKVVRNYCRAFNRKMTGSNTYPKKFILAAILTTVKTGVRKTSQKAAAVYRSAILKA